MIGSNSISGKLFYTENFTGFSGDPELQNGYYLVLSWADADLSDITSLKIGLSPSYSGSEPPEAINDPDKNCVLKIHDTTQEVKIITSDGTNTNVKYYSLNGIELVTA